MIQYKFIIKNMIIRWMAKTNNLIVLKSNKNKMCIKFL